MVAEKVTPRPSARLVIVSPEGRALLFRFRFPERTFWATPGGALAEGESYRAAALRELAEETGIASPIGAEFHRQETTYRGPDGNMLYADERYFAVRAPEQVIHREHWEAVEREMIQAVEWLSPAEIRQLEHPVFPANFADLVECVLKGEV